MIKYKGHAAKGNVKMPNKPMEWEVYHKEREWCLG